MKTDNKISILSIIISVIIAAPLSAYLGYLFASKEFDNQRIKIKTEKVIRLKRDLITKIEGYLILIREVGQDDFGLDLNKSWTVPDSQKKEFGRKIYDSYDLSSIYLIVDQLNENDFDKFLQNYHKPIHIKYANITVMQDVKKYSKDQIAFYFYKTFFGDRLYYDLIGLKDNEIIKKYKKLN